MTMGHEFAAEVVQNGEGSARFSSGDLVAVQPTLFCGECENCLNGFTNCCTNKEFFGVLTKDGAFAEYIVSPEKLLYKLPENCSPYVGAMTEPYSVAYGAVKKAGSLTGKSVLILGAGMIGLCILQLVKAQEPAMIIVSDLSRERLDTALALGADKSVNPRECDALAEISGLTGGKMIDVSIEAVGVQDTANLSVKALKLGGTAVWVGNLQGDMTLNMQDIVVSARKVIGSYTFTHEEFGEVVKLFGSGAFEAERLISRVVSLEDAPAAFIELNEHPGGLIKIIVDPTL
jgi:threonine dehydrogenase-like Zn-dependent dehydrogenase